MFSLRTHITLFLVNRRFRALLCFFLLGLRVLKFRKLPERKFKKTSDKLLNLTYAFRIINKTIEKVETRKCTYNI